MPAIFGLTCANIVLMTLADYPVPHQSFFAASKLRPRLYADIHMTIKSKYDSFGTSSTQPNCPFSVDDVAYIVEEVFRGRSVLEPFHTTRLNIFKWRSESGFSWGNVVCMTKAEGAEHEKRILKGNERVEDVYGPAVVSRVNEIWKEEGIMRGIRWGNMYTNKD
jgi:tRNA threonylcarbamoyladenosine dehydratase